LDFALRAAGERDLVVLMPTDVDGTGPQVQDFARERTAARMADAAPPPQASPAPSASVEPVGA
jgi:hypothetical protein